MSLTIRVQLLFLHLCEDIKLDQNQTTSQQNDLLSSIKFLFCQKQNEKEKEERRNPNN
jgi:hypothetical protein